jgi:hypothetical protein
MPIRLLNPSVLLVQITYPGYIYAIRTSDGAKLATTVESDFSGGLVASSMTNAKEPETQSISVF